MKIYILGSGAMGGAMARGLRESGHEVVVVGREGGSISNLKAEGFEAEYYGASYDVEGKTVILAFKPYALPEVSKILKGRAKLCVSVLARTTLSALKEAVSAEAYAACMPNLAARYGASATAFVGDEAAAEVLRGFGKCVKFETEREFAAAGVVSGCGPAYLAVVADALASGAVMQGLKASAAHEMVAALFGSAAELLARSHPALLRDAVCSPAGTTIEGVAKLEEKGVRGAFIAALKASADKQNS